MSMLYILKIKHLMKIKGKMFMLYIIKSKDKSKKSNKIVINKRKAKQNKGREKK